MEIRVGTVKGGEKKRVNEEEREYGLMNYRYDGII